MARQRESKPVNNKQIELLEILLVDVAREYEYDLQEIRNKWTADEAAILIGELVLEKYGAI